MLESFDRAEWGLETYFLSKYQMLSLPDSQNWDFKGEKTKRTNIWLMLKLQDLAVLDFASDL